MSEAHQFPSESSPWRENINFWLTRQTSPTAPSIGNIEKNWGGGGWRGRQMKVMVFIQKEVERATRCMPAIVHLFLPEARVLRV